MSHFTPEQLTELETIYGLVRKEETLPVRDGVVTKLDTVWWRCDGGPEKIKAGEHWRNIREYPELHQLRRPKTSVTYLD